MRDLAVDIIVHGTGPILVQRCVKIHVRRKKRIQSLEMMDGSVEPPPAVDRGEFFVAKKRRCDIDVKPWVGIIHGQPRQTGDRVLQRESQHWGRWLLLARRAQMDEAAQGQGLAQLCVYDGEQLGWEVALVSEKCFGKGEENIV